MLKFFKNKKGFTLIELIVVLAVLAIIMAIAIPRFVGIQDESRINADVATAEQIIKAARLMEAKRNDGNTTTYVDGSGGTTDNWDSDIMAWPTPESGGETSAGEFDLDYNADDEYEVEWEVEKGSFLDGRIITVTEGESGYEDSVAP